MVGVRGLRFQYPEEFVKFSPRNLSERSKGEFMDAGQPPEGTPSLETVFERIYDETELLPGNRTVT
jgi:hypothetical protein